MKVTRVEINSEGFANLLKDPLVLADLTERAQRIADAAVGASPGGAQFSVENVTSATRARVRVATANYAARRGEADNAALTRALDAGRG